MENNYNTYSENSEDKYNAYSNCCYDDYEEEWFSTEGDLDDFIFYE